MVIHTKLYQCVPEWPRVLQRFIQNKSILNRAIKKLISKKGASMKVNGRVINEMERVFTFWPYGA